MEEPNPSSPNSSLSLSAPNTTSPPLSPPPTPSLSSTASHHPFPSPPPSTSNKIEIFLQV
ncbi:hypothetical protein LguiB_032690 [Lonicera macranthoides]